MFQLADRWGEPDPRKIAELPVHIIMHWQAFFNLQAAPPPAFTPTDVPPPELTAPTPVADQYADIMRVLM
ncbi:hypothetical protein CBW54_02935 [Yersinia kristensenii]|nr:hypothetical protein CBW54_02935 [Yersinia kristensenii]